MKNNWQRKRLGEIGAIFNGDSINARVKKSKYSNVTEGLSYVATKDIDRDSHRIKYDNGIRIPLNETSFKIARKNSVLICAEGGNAGRKIAYLKEDVCFGNKLLAIETIKSVDSHFVYYWYLTSAFSKAFKSKVFGVIGGISIKNFKNLTTPIPFLPEQNRIVKVLDEVFEKVEKVRENVEKNLQNAKELFESYLQSVLENNGENWEIKKLSDVADYFIGLTYSPKDVSDKGTIVLRSSNVKNGKLDFSDIVRVNRPIKECLKVKNGDILMCSRNGSKRLIGKTATIHVLKEDMTFGTFMTIIRSQYNSYLSWFFVSNEFRKQIGIGENTMINQITKYMLDDISLPLPSLLEQQTIIQKLDALSAKTKKLEATYQQKLDDLEELKKSVLKKAFNGEL